MPVTQRLRKIIWTIDVLKENNRMHEQKRQTIRALIRGHENEVQVQPVYVLPLKSSDLTAELFYQSEESHAEKATAVLEERLKGDHFVGQLSPSVILSESHSMRSMIDSLNQYAVENNADLIIVGTHAKRGIKRLFLGSFAETLLLHSVIPVLIVQAGVRAVHEIQEILFPTDFGKSSEVVFDQVLSLAVSLNTKINLLHIVPDPLWIDRYAELGSARESYFRAGEEAALKSASNYREKASEAGVPLTVQIELFQTGVHDVILDRAKMNPNQLIAMAAHSGAVTAALAGSVTRKVVRGASCPVWVLHAPVSVHPSELPKVA